MTTATLTSSAPSRTGRVGRTISRRGLPYLLIGPAVLYLGAMMLWPLIRGVMMSFTDTKLINPDGGRSVGLDNYRRLLEGDVLWNSIATTLIYTAATVVLAVGIGTGAALLLNRGFRGRALVRGLLALPWALPTVATALIFAWMYNQTNGVFNAGLRGLGIGEVGWLTDPDWGLFSVTIASVWVVFPLVMLVVVASLQSLPTELVEAAALDGAGDTTILRHVTWPHIAPTVRVMALLMTIWSIRRFEIIYLLTGGGPVDSTTTIVVSVYRQAFQDQNLGRAAAIGCVGLALSLLVTAVYYMSESRHARRNR